MSNSTKQPQCGPGGKSSGSRIFSNLRDLLSYYRRIAPRRKAILAPNYAPVTYAELWARTDAAGAQLRRLGISQTDRVAVVLPKAQRVRLRLRGRNRCGLRSPKSEISPPTNGTVISVISDSSAIDARGYEFGEPRRRTHPRHTGHRLLPRPGDGPGAFNLVGSATRRAVAGDFAVQRGDDAFILLTSGTTSRPKMVPLTHASVCLSAYNAGAALALGPGIGY